MGKHQSLTLLMILCYSSRQKPRMTLISEASRSMRQKQMLRPTPKYGLELRQCYVRFGGRIEGQKGIVNLQKDEQNQLTWTLRSLRD